MVNFPLLFLTIIPSHAFLLISMNKLKQNISPQSLSQLEEQCSPKAKSHSRDTSLLKTARVLHLTHNLSCSGKEEIAHDPTQEHSASTATRQSSVDDGLRFIPLPAHYHRENPGEMQSWFQSIPLGTLKRVVLSLKD